MSTLRQHLVQGGQPSTYISQTPPKIHPHCYILGAAHPTVEQADPRVDGWLLSDFYAFNYLCRRIGSAQKWLTAADPFDVLEKYGGELLHGNPYEDRKVVLSKDLIESNQLTDPIVLKQDDMVQTFLKEAKKASELARKENVPLVLFVFCHGLPGYQMMLDNSKGLTAMTLKSHLEPGAQVTLVTPACYSGGWLINPDFNSTVMTAADDESMSTSWPLSDSLRRACGSVFASSFIKTLASTASPLVESTTQGGPAVPGVMRDGQTSPDLQPESPNEQQTSTYNAFCQTVWDSCKQLTRLYSAHAFSFSAQQDQWDHSWTGLTGIPVTHYEQRWNRLQTVQYKGTHERKASLDQDPSNTTFGGHAPPAASGSGRDTVDTMVESMRSHRIQEMARIFVEETCPGDWDKGYGFGYGYALRDFVQGKRPNKVPNPDGWRDELEIVASIQFRWQMALLTDHIIKIHGLPMPDGKDCLFWNQLTWQAKIQERIPRWQDRRAKISQKLQIGGFIIFPTLVQGPVWPRPWVYTSSALVEANLSEEETMRRVDQILSFMRQVREYEERRFISSIIQNPNVWARGKDWLKGVGRRVRGHRHSPYRKQ